MQRNQRTGIEISAHFKTHKMTSKDRLSNSDYFPVIIIGAGLSGIAAGCQLKTKLGLGRFRIYDRNDGIGVRSHSCSLWTRIDSILGDMVDSSVSRCSMRCVSTRTSPIFHDCCSQYLLALQACTPIPSRKTLHGQLSSLRGRRLRHTYRQPLINSVFRLIFS